MSSKPRAARAAAALIAASVSLGAPSMGAAQKPKVLVLPYQHLDKGLPDDLGEQTTIVITREMSVGGLVVIRADDVADAPAPAKRSEARDQPKGDPGAGSKADKLLARARDAMDEGEFDTAAKSLKQAVSLLEDNADAVPDLRLLAEAYLQLGVAYFRDGEEDEGDEMLNKAVHLDPERKLDAEDYPPIFIRVFDRARFNVLRRPRAEVEVKATPGAQVLFDGRNMGKVPLLLKDVLPGRHWIRVERPGDPVRVREVQVSSKRTLAVEFEGAAGASDDSGPPVGIMGAIAANEISRDNVSQLQKAGRRSGADFVMFGAIYKTDTAYHIHTLYVSVKDGTVGRLQDIAFDLDMLSAEIEVFKLADDAKKQALSGKLQSVVAEPTFAVAPKFKARPKRRAVRPGQRETKVTVVSTAPPPTKPPKSLYAEASKAPMPTATESRTPTPAVTETKATLLPKDEISSGGAGRSSGAAATMSTAGASSLTTTTVIPKDEVSENGSGSDWWIWVLVGVAAVGAAGAGGFLIFSSQSSDEGNLEVRW